MSLSLGNTKLQQAEIPLGCHIFFKKGKKVGLNQVQL